MSLVFNRIGQGALPKKHTGGALRRHAKEGTPNPNKEGIAGCALYVNRHISVARGVILESYRLSFTGFARVLENRALMRTSPVFALGRTKMSKSRTLAQWISSTLSVIPPWL